MGVESGQKMKRRDVSQNDVTVPLHAAPYRIIKGVKRVEHVFDPAGASVADGFLGDRISLNITGTEPGTFVFHITEQ